MSRDVTRSARPASPIEPPQGSETGGAPSELAPRGLDRRDLGRWALAAAAGIAAGAALQGCGGEAEVDGKDDGLLVQEPHVCRGLNTCKGLGAGGQNECAGQGTCASVEAHGCAGINECAGQGGCKAMAGRNTCKGQGGCGVPLGHGAWDGARKAYEAQMAAAGRDFGEAPSESGS